jgi:hypothetical protein
MDEIFEQIQLVNLQETTHSGVFGSVKPATI